MLMWILGALGVLILGFFLMFASWKHYRTSIRRDFLAYLEAERPELQVDDVDSERIIVSTEEGGHGSLYLDRLYSASTSIKLEDKESLRELFAQYADTIAEGQQALSVDAERDRGRIYPRIVRRDWALEAARQVGSDPLPFVPLGPDGLDVVFVLDSENSVAYLQSEQLADLGMSPEEAFELAVANLGKSFRPEAVRPIVEEGSMSVVKSEDTYDAARLLLIPDSLQEGESVAALIPDRDTLVLTPVPDDGDWRSLTKLAKSADGDPLWMEPLVVTPHGVAAVGA
jgi:hypothetical protein